MSARVESAPVGRFNVGAMARFFFPAIPTLLRSIESTL